MKPGVYIRKDEIEFAVHSSANRLWLLLFDSAEAERPCREIEMKGGPLWRVKVPGLRPGDLGRQAAKNVRRDVQRGRGENTAAPS